MSGGVDSSVAAARAVEAGHEVVGVHLALSRHRAVLREGSRGCCTVEDAMDARRVADRLGIPFYVWDFSERFAETVVRDFVDEYAAGRTPNPCLRCNEEIKFAALLDRALALGFDALATGHYADVVPGPDGLELHRAAAGPKDQSYVLGVLTPQQLAHAMFPLGAAASKEEVRAEAAARGLVTAAKPDSYDICFIPDGDTRGYLGSRIDLRPGAIVDADGAVVGSHDGALAFTVGQRRGLRLAAPAPDGRPRFVLEVRPSSGEVVVGPREALAVSRISGARSSALGPLETATEVQVRAHAEPVPCRVSVGADAVVIDLEEPIDGVAPGQSAVLYAGTRVLGQVTVDRALAAVGG
ncbi:MAG: tRNA 2-thiouridine(34) synthase MnmA [Micrococcales bacterium 73-13]|nr:MAG: tRNA 2-thiouridine(34) synthase MnmA [Micrococcales bacterium 73-13]